jgi:hypothetical protein
MDGSRKIFLAEVSGLGGQAGPEMVLSSLEAAGFPARKPRVEASKIKFPRILKDRVRSLGLFSFIQLAVFILCDRSIACMTLEPIHLTNSFACRWMLVYTHPLCPGSAKPPPRSSVALAIMSQGLGRILPRSTPR